MSFSRAGQGRRENENSLRRRQPRRQTFVISLHPKILKPRWLQEKYDAVILSDFARSHTPTASQKLIAKQVSKGTGLLMIGGWGSFSGPSGGWRGSLIEKILPVKCSPGDDRLNLPGGAFIVSKRRHPIFHTDRRLND